MYKFVRSVVVYYKFLTQSTPLVHYDDVASAADELTAAFKSRTLQLEFHRADVDGRTDEQSSSIPQEQMWTLQLDAPHLLELVTDKSVHSHWLILLVRHGHLRVVSAVRRRREAQVLFSHVDAVNACNLRPRLHAE